jgi:hypothetical protein
MFSVWLIIICQQAFALVLRRSIYLDLATQNTTSSYVEIFVSFTLVQAD